MPDSNLERFLLEAIDESLSSLGESSKQAIYFHLDKSFNITKQEIPNNVAAFIDALEKIFGLGANFIEALILAKLNEKIEQCSKWHVSKDLTLVEYVASAKQGLTEKKRSENVEVEMSQCTRVEA